MKSERQTAAWSCHVPRTVLLRRFDDDITTMHSASHLPCTPSHTAPVCLSTWLYRSFHLLLLLLLSLICHMTCGGNKAAISQSQLDTVNDRSAAASVHQRSHHIISHHIIHLDKTACSSCLHVKHKMMLELLQSDDTVTDRQTD